MLNESSLNRGIEEGIEVEVESWVEKRREDDDLKLP